MAVDDANRETTARGDFDPRYDPEFQRGYRPQPGERARTRVRDVATRPETAADTAVNTTANTAAARRPAAGTAAATALERPSQRPVEHTPPAPQPVPFADAPASSAVVAPDSWETEVERERAVIERERGTAQPSDVVAYGDVAPEFTPARRGGILDAVDFSPRRNRAVLILWLVGAGLVALGVVLYVMSVFTSYTNPTSSADVTGLVFSQLGWMLAGPLITVGLATLVVLLGLTLLASHRPAQPASNDSDVLPPARRPEA
jgi:hypothetical protein